MDQNLFMGLLIAALVVLLGIATAVFTLIVKPVINLNKSITELNGNIKYLNDKSESFEARLSKHGDQIDKTMINVERHEALLSTHSSDLNYLKSHMEATSKKK